MEQGKIYFVVCWSEALGSLCFLCSHRFEGVINEAVAKSNNQEAEKHVDFLMCVFFCVCV